MDCFTLLRSVLFVPADSESKLAKAPMAGADALLFDLEDAVAPERKPRARVMLHEMLAGSARLAPSVLLRFNRYPSADFEEDCRLLRDPSVLASVDGIVLAKCESPEALEPIEAALRATGVPTACGLLPLIESARGLLHAPAIAAASPRVVALAFGAEDFCADTGIVPTADEMELLHARSTIVVASRAARRQAIDTPYLNYRDESGLTTAAERARHLGFSGKLAIHPRQVAAINRAFLPSGEEIADARRVVEWAATHGFGATAMRQRMIDAAIVRRARAVLRLAGEGESEA